MPPNGSATRFTIPKPMARMAMTKAMISRIPRIQAMMPALARAAAPPGP